LNTEGFSLGLPPPGVGFPITAITCDVGDQARSAPPLSLHPKV